MKTNETNRKTCLTRQQRTGLSYWLDNYCISKVNVRDCLAESKVYLDVIKPKITTEQRKIVMQYIDFLENKLMVDKLR